MKLASFLANGLPSYGIVQDNTLLDIGAVLRPVFPDLKALLAAGYLAEAQEARAHAPELDLSQTVLLPPIPNPAKIFCIGKNYEDHRLETGAEKTAFPAVFLRFADTLVAHEQSAWIPASSTEIDYEGELAVVIGRGGRHISEAAALDHVAGYACFNEISIRDWQRHTPQFTPGKNFPHTGGFGPWLVTADEIPNPQDLDLTTRLNGAVVQHASTAEMIFPVTALIAYCSSFTPLSPGDIISTGTPGGVGAKRKPQLFMKAGDVVEIEVQSIGTLRNTMAPDPS